MALCSYIYIIIYYKIIYNLYNYIYIYNYIVYIYILYIYISHKMAALRFLQFTKLLLALSSFAQPCDQMISIQEDVFIILSHRQACAGRFREERAGKRTGPVTKWPPRRLLFTRLEIVFFIISSFTKRTKVVKT